MAMRRTQLLTWQSFSSFFSFLCSGSGGLLGRYFSLSAGEIEFRCKEKKQFYLKRSPNAQLTVIWSRQYSAVSLKHWQQNV